MSDSVETASYNTVSILINNDNVATKKTEGSISFLKNVLKFPEGGLLAIQSLQVDATQIPLFFPEDPESCKFLGEGKIYYKNSRLSYGDDDTSPRWLSTLTSSLDKNDLSRGFTLMDICAWLALKGIVYLNNGLFRNDDVGGRTVFIDAEIFHALFEGYFTFSNVEDPTKLMINNGMTFSLKKNLCSFPGIAVLLEDLPVAQEYFTTTTHKPDETLITYPIVKTLITSDPLAGEIIYHINNDLLNTYLIKIPPLGEYEIRNLRVRIVVFNKKGELLDIPQSSGAASFIKMVFISN